MKSLLLHPQKSLWLCFLTFLSITVYSQTNTLKAVADTIDLYPGVPCIYDILANDTIPANDTIRNIDIHLTGHVGCKKIHGSTWTFTFSTLGWGTAPELTVPYTLWTMSQNTSSTSILFRVHDKSYSYLDINNVRARFSSSGSHFHYENPEYEVPKGSGQTSIFLNTLWIGGKDSLNQLHLAAERYGLGSFTGAAWKSPDFYAGPVMDSIHYSFCQDTVWNYVWNLKKTDIDYHRAHCWEAGYTPIHDILTWPGNGDVSLGQAQKLAPFSDRNGDGIYDPFDGDYPEIRGDQALFFIFNDDRGPHLETGGLKLGVEIHGMAYAFDMADDSAFKNTVFLNYKLYNRSKNTYDSTLLGIFTDIDLGYANDDYVLCDVERNMYIGYNGTPVDGTGQSNAYGDSPPAQAVTILGGPYMDADGIDNPRFDNGGYQLCDFSVNGMNFGDSIVDNERYGLQRFIYINNSNAGVPAYMTDPLFSIDYYQLLCGKWKDSTFIQYGGNGHLNMGGGYGPSCRFMFPGESDTTNWGIGCAPPYGPKNWTEETAFNNPGDRRGVEVTGPITFHPGDVQELDLMFNWARTYGEHSPMASVEKLRQVADRISNAFAANQLPGGDLFYGIGDSGKEAEKTVKIYPNPASDQITVAFSSNDLPGNTTLDLLTVDGNCITRVVLSDHWKSTRVDVSAIPAGVYFVRLTTADAIVVKKVIVMH
jgi:hypothetical protein